MTYTVETEGDRIMRYIVAEYLEGLCIKVTEYETRLEADNRVEQSCNLGILCEVWLKVEGEKAKHLSTVSGYTNRRVETFLV